MNSPVSNKSLDSVQPFFVGSCESWVLHDGTFLIPAAAVARGAPPSELALLLGDALRTDGQFELSVNVMLVRSGRELILIDAGCGQAYAASLGLMETSLLAAGFAPGDITAVVFTHLHLDHIAGAIDFAARTVRFPNARFFAQREEVSFWQQPEPQLDGTGVPAEQRVAIVRGIHDALSIFGKRLELFSANETLFENFSAVPLPGHTPFHTGFLLRAGGDALLNSGDVMGDPRLHVPHPEWAQLGDAQPAIAIETRRSLCDRAMRENFSVFGYHFRFPGLGRIRFDLSTRVPVFEPRF